MNSWRILDEILGEIPRGYPHIIYKRNPKEISERCFGYISEETSEKSPGRISECTPGGSSESISGGIAERTQRNIRRFPTIIKNS